MNLNPTCKGMSASPSIRILEIYESEKPRLLTGKDHIAPPPDGVLRWIDIERPSDVELSLLSDQFGFHPLAIEDCAHFDQRPKLEDYHDHIFLVTHGFELPPVPNPEPRLLELHTFLAKRYLVTVHDESLVPLNGVRERLQSDPSAGRRGTDFIRYLIADAMVDAFFPVVDQFASRIEELEDALLNRGSDRNTLREILQLKRLLVSLRRVLPAQRDVLAQLAKRERGHVSDKTAPYFRDVYDHLLRINESVEANRELLGNLLDAYHWTISQRTNEIVKRLTIVSAVFLPLTFITGFFGQNFEALPFGSTRLMLAMLVSCVAVPIGMLYFFLRSRWF